MRFHKFCLLCLTRSFRSPEVRRRLKMISTSENIPTLVRSTNRKMRSLTTFKPPSVALMFKEVDKENIEDEIKSAAALELRNSVPVAVTPPPRSEEVPFENSLVHMLGVKEKSLALFPEVVGHRGAPFIELENTRAGFQVAASLGCDAVELDVFLLKCGTLVVFHGGGTDANPGCLRNYCGIEGNILNYTAEDAKKLKFNPWFEEFGCPTSKIVDTNIPTLEDVLLDAKETGITVLIELKGPGTAEPVLELVERLDMVHQCHFSSFDHRQISRIRELRPQRGSDGHHIYKTGALFGSHIPENYISLSLAIGASEIHLKYDTCTALRVQEIHANGMCSMAWFRGPMGMKEDATYKYHDVGNEDKDMYLAVMKTGVRRICVNRPDIILEMRQDS